MLTQPTIEKRHAWHLTAMAQAFEQQRGSAPHAELPFDDRFGLLVEAEWIAREQRRLAQRLRTARVRSPASLEDVDFTTPRGLVRDVVLSLGTGAWIRDHHNLLITGPTGIGKSWLASAFVESACRHGFTATYVRAPRLLHERAVSRGDGSYARLLARVAKLDLLAIDDWFLAPLQLAEAAKQVADAKKQIADLERQLALRNQNSTITSKPPASDGLAGRQRVRGRRRKSRRKPGGQPGHPGHSRSLVPAERVNATIDLVPERCRHCQRSLQARDEVGEPWRHHGTELPPIEAHITEYRCHRRRCPHCDRLTHARLPEDVVGQFGPQLTALIAYLTVVCLMPRLVVQRFLEGTLQIPISVGRTQHAWEEASAAVAAPYAELEAALRHEAVLNADETGHRTNGDKRWLWTFVAHTFVVYRRVPRLRRAEGGPRGDLRRHSRQRPFAQLSEIRRRPAPILLGARHT